MYSFDQQTSNELSFLEWQDKFSQTFLEKV